MTASDLRQCAAMLRGGSRTFHAAGLVLPRRYREPAFAIYAFCRLADDAIDDGRADPAAALAGLHDRLDRIYRGRPVAVAADRAFAAVVERFGIPRALPDALLEGFAWDAENRRYPSLDELVRYAVRVAGTVGGMMSLVMGRREPAVLARAIELGVAMQLTNIARDVGEDARAGRIYLPLAWLCEAGIDPDRFVAEPGFDHRVATVVQRLLDTAALVYRRSEGGIAHLPKGCRPAIAAARLLYAGIGDEVARNGCDSVTRRAVLSTRSKLARVGRVAALSLAPARPLAPPALPEALFLVEAVAAQVASRHRVVAAAEIPWWHLRDRAVRTLELFERLERRQRAAP